MASRITSLPDSHALVWPICYDRWAHHALPDAVVSPRSPSRDVDGKTGPVDFHQVGKIMCVLHALCPVKRLQEAEPKRGERRPTHVTKEATLVDPYVMAAVRHSRKRLQRASFVRQDFADLVRCIARDSLTRVGIKCGNGDSVRDLDQMRAVPNRMP